MRDILNESNKEIAQKCFYEAIELGLNFKLNNDVKEKVFDKEKLQELLKLPIDENTTENVIDYFKKNIIPYCTNFSNVNFMGFPDAGNTISGITGAIISDFMQQNIINSTFCAPIATYMEIAVLKWLREIVGYKIDKINDIWDVGGIITYGGTGSNVTAMLLARENFIKNTMVNGVTIPENYKIIIPKGIGHYSIRSASMWLGCGDNVIEVETKNFKYDLEKLKNALNENKGHIMAVVCYAGDSRTMTIDNLEEVYELVKSCDEKIWLHADACHGFSLAFSDKLKYKIKGLERFDSISTDPHKVLAIPYCISALLIKEPSKMKLVSSASDLIMNEDFAFGQITPFIGSKSWISLKLWFSMKTLGKNGYAKIIEKRCELATYLKNKILQSNEFILFNDVNINSVVFMYVKDKSKIGKDDINYINELNLKIYNRILNEGKYYLHKFTIPDNKGIIDKNAILIPLRYMSGNDNLEKDDIDNMLKYIYDIGKEFSNE